jgi:ketosteroid isomerase-like protein
VRRATEIAVAAAGPAGERLEIEAEGFEARCLLHEIDHLDGILFLDRVDSLSRDVFRRRRFAAPETRPAGRAVLRAVGRLNQAFAGGGLEALGDLVAGDVEFRPPPDLPDPGPFRGPDEVAGFLSAFAETWHELRVDVEGVVAAGDDRAVARLRLSGRGSGSGVEAVGLLVGAFVVDRGRLTRVALFRSDAEALRDAGLH